MMTMPQIPGSFPSATLVQALLDETRRLRRDWARLATESASAFTAFREEAAALPQTFLDQYTELQSRKDQLTTRIQTDCQTAESAQWVPPAADRSLQEFETQLDALRTICEAIEKQIAEKSSRTIAVLKSVQQLQSTDAALMSDFAAVRQQADAWMLQVEAEPHVVSAADHDRQLEPWQCLLRLTMDAAARRHSSSESPVGRVLSWEQCEADLDVVGQAFGRRIAIEALRGRLATGSDDDRNHDLTDKLSADDSSGSVGPPVESVPGEVSSSGLTTMPVSAQQLAEASGRLRGRAWTLCPDLSAPFGAATGDNADRLRAIGYLNLSRAIDLAGSLVAARDDNPGIYRQEFRTLLGLFAEALCAVRSDGNQSANAAGPPEQQAADRWLAQCLNELPDGDLPQADMMNTYLSPTADADPAANADLARRLQNFEHIWKAAWRNETCRDALQLATRKFPINSPTVADWNELDRRVVELLRCGLRPDDELFRQQLLPIAAAVPLTGVIPDVEFSPGVRRVWDAMEDFVIRQELQQSDDVVPVEVTAVVAEARRLLAGGKVAIVGATPIAHVRERLQEMLGLKKLKWLAASKTNRVRHLESRMRGVSLVILVTRLLGPQHDDVREICAARNIPWVQSRISSGFGVGHLANVIMDQASPALRKRGSESEGVQTAEHRSADVA